MEHTPKDPSRVAGWGVDVDPKNDPTYPMKHRTDGEHAGYSGQRPPPQHVTAEALRSPSRSHRTTPRRAASLRPPPTRAAPRRPTAPSDPPAALGTSAPPSGPSGAIRRLAFQYSESSYAHWLPLMLADRGAAAEGNLAGVKM